ncbi:DUF222 domain-containing protein [Microbacterium invictum]|uniref:DUF222 domain-containing protein n=1 Tax=Microbacterium invictum TaxID=515415 RepID=A0AA40SN78_9MICO|nr:MULTISPECIES: DUF222 domain-containing protein [Microbacterium]MBB4139331.1 hypothetical protein [Microbacterium invictum]
MGVDATVTTATTRALMDEIVALETQKATIEASIEKSMAALADQMDEAIRRLPSDRQAAEIPLRDICARLAARLRVSDRTIQGRMLTAQTLLNEYPTIVEAWHDGRISRGHVRVITEAGERLSDPEVRATFEQHLLRVAEEESVARTRPVAEIMAERLNPVPFAERHAYARARRTMQLRPLRDAMSRLTLDVPTVIGQGIFDRATQLAKTERFQFDGNVVRELAQKQSMLEVALTVRVRTDLVALSVGTVEFVREGAMPNEDTTGAAPIDEVPPRQASIGEASIGEAPAASAGERATDRPVPRVKDPRTLDQRRVDVAAELLLTGIPIGIDPESALNITTTVRVTVPVLTLVGDDVEPGLAPAELAGRVPIDPATARRLVAKASGWDRVLTHPVTGMVLAVDRYRPTAAQRRYLDARDMQCRFFGCTRPVHECDHDHTIEYSRGGPTDVRCLADECKRHHPLRHHSEWIVIPRADGVFEWIDPGGRRYRDRPAPTVGFLPDSFFQAQHRRDGLARQDDGGPAPF